jgi:hypothetical protein
MYADLFVVLTYTSVFAMLYDISRVLYNPFGFREDMDIPHEIVGGARYPEPGKKARTRTELPTKKAERYREARCSNQVIAQEYSCGMSQTWKRTSRSKLSKSSESEGKMVVYRLSMEANGSRIVKSGMAMTNYHF